MDPKVEFINVYQKRSVFFFALLLRSFFFCRCHNFAEPKENQKRPNQKSKVDPLELLPDSVVLCRPISKKSQKVRLAGRAKKETPLWHIDIKSGVSHLDNVVFSIVV